MLESWKRALDFWRTRTKRTKPPCLLLIENSQKSNFFPCIFINFTYKFQGRNWSWKVGIVLNFEFLCIFKATPLTFQIQFQNKYWPFKGRNQIGLCQYGERSLWCEFLKVIRLDELCWDFLSNSIPSNPIDRWMRQNVKLP